MSEHKYAGEIPGIEMADEPGFVEGMPQRLALHWWESTYSWLLSRSPCGGEKEPNYYGCEENKDEVCVPR